ncbi:class III lanthionine synthetase LanKC [Actinophytocola xanthii]|uniref:non-specific serine/threonine protein kinase n=1 Tax=Actinophytocola xanthii TaxID=1912961 RepID=A0A1Q8CJU5_9PSEU|nr:class III lanthionine synthetase LanKC [Actinophytocola xanthii]OLF14622.1 hypothetical protein BU204_26100 [Actinophytocola xanthii]
MSRPQPGPLFVESLDRLDDDATRFPHARDAAPPGWWRAEQGGWVHLEPEDTRLPDQGWKIHASAVGSQAARVVAEVWDYCVRRGISFKFLRSQAMLSRLNGKSASRTSSGKLVTIYPADEHTLELTLKELSERLRGVVGPHILNDLRWGEGPLYLRYGGFRMRYCFSPAGDHVPAVARPDGVLVPDLRGTAFRTPSWVRIPAFVQAQVEAARAGSGGPLPYRVEKALLFSNGGGVYRAVERSGLGRTVVLREARPHAGLDMDDADAVARLDREHAMLDRLADLEFVPRVLGRFRHWEHHFLVEELVEGEPLHEAMGRRHPLLRPDPTDAELAEYSAWANATFERIRTAVGRLHERGVVFGDLKPGNIMVRPDGRVCLVDFETAYALGEENRPTLVTEGFSADWAREGTAADDYALACIRLAMFLPFTELLRFAPEKVGQLVRLAEERFAVPADFGSYLRSRLTPPGALPAHQLDWPTGAEGWDQLFTGMAAAIVDSATPGREDRLFPGDARLFDRQAAGLAFGAAGVLHALHVTGHDRYPEFDDHVEWLVRAARRTRWPRPGLFDGLAGTAVVLDELGRHAEALETLDRLRKIDLTGCGIGLFGGLAGVGLTLLHFGEDATEIGEELAAGLRTNAASAGLMHGWSGPALLFTHLFDVDGNLAWLRHARTALARDLGRCGVPRGRRLQVRDGEHWLTGLERGSAGIGIAVQEYLRRHHDPHLAAVRELVRDGLDTELLLTGGLLTGQAGVLLGTAHLGASPARHLRMLGAHAVRHRGNPAFTLDGMLRLSMDLATGTAGVLLAVHTAVHGCPAPLPGLGTRS